MQPVVVYDTNVLISGMIWGGIPYRCIELARQDTVEGVTCVEILNEFEQKLTIKFGFSSPGAAEIVTELLDCLQIVEIPNRLKGVTTDPDDNMVIECAVVGGCYPHRHRGPKTSVTTRKLSRHSYCKTSGFPCTV